MKCARCGDTTPRLSLDQRYCNPCRRDLEARTAKPAAWQPTWMRRLTAKEMPL